MKRAFDLITSGFALSLLSPLLLPLIILLRCTGEGEILYRQQRIGRGNKLFDLYKFATMLKDSPSLSGGDITVANDPRILPIGRFLRDWKINELPQLVNVFLGDMSIIGWRPLTPRVANLFPREHWEALKDWRPGLSGVGSVVFRDEEALLADVADRQAVYELAIVPYKSALEIWYTRHQSFWLDMKLIAITAIMVVNSKYDFISNLPNLPPVPDALATLRDRSASGY